MPNLDDDALAQLVLDGLAVEVELFATASESATLHRSPAYVAAVSPATPDRSIFNSVYPVDPGALDAQIDEIERRYDAAGVRAWTVWIPGDHPVGPELLAPRGHVLDGSPRSMALELDELLPPSRELPEGVTLIGGDIREAAAINDRAYGLGPGAWASALTRPPSVPMQWAVAVLDGEPVACAGGIDHGTDVCITGVGTVPELKGNGLAGQLIHALLAEARGRGMRTASLQASKAGAPVYERLGFRDVGHTELWEKRREP